MRTINGRTRQQLGKRSERAAIIAGDRIEFLVKAFAMEGKELTSPRHSTNWIGRKQPLKHPLLSVSDAFTSFSGRPLLLQQISYTRCPATLKNRVLIFIAYSATQPSFWVLFDKPANSEAVLFGIRKSLLLMFPPVRFWGTVFLLCPLF